MRTGNNIRLRKDGRYEARYIKGRDVQNRIIYGYCYGQTYEEAAAKRFEKLRKPQPMKELNHLILGAGSHGQEVLELAQGLRIFRKISFLDDMVTEQVIGPCRDFENYCSEYSVVIPAVGNTELRIQWMNSLMDAGHLIPTLIHPTAVISHSAQIGDGTVICAKATIDTGALSSEKAVLFPVVRLLTAMLYFLTGRILNATKPTMHPTATS